jgi:hypothetical protein
MLNSKEKFIFVTIPLQPESHGSLRCLRERRGHGRVKNYFVNQRQYNLTHDYLRPIRIQEGFCEGSHR